MQPKISPAPEGGDAALSLTPPVDPSAPLSALVAAIAGLFRRKTSRQQLTNLSDRQLRDAGIDLALVRRGPAIAARPDPNLEGPH